MHVTMNIDFNIVVQILIMEYCTDNVRLMLAYMEQI